MQIDRRTMLKAGAATVAASTPAAVAGATLAAGKPDPIIALAQRLEAADREHDRLEAAVSAILDRIPDLLLWTPAELEEHRIDGKKDKPRCVSSRELENNDRWDSPTGPKPEYDSRDDGATLVQTITTRRPKPAEAEMAAWRSRCAARRALFDAKRAAQEAAERDSGLLAAEEAAKRAYDAAARIFDRIISTHASSTAGVLAKMRLAQADADATTRVKRLIASALSDLERIEGAT